MTEFGNLPTDDIIPASDISSVAAGSLVATDVQAALNELDTEKAVATSPIAAATALKAPVPIAFADRATFADGDTTPSVAGGNFFMANNSGATSITTFDDGEEGQIIVILAVGTTTTIVAGGGSPAMYLTGGTNFVMGNLTSLTLIALPGGDWLEIARKAT